MKYFFWILTIFGCLAGAACLLSAVMAQGAPQQAGAAALAVAFVVIPYGLARAITEMLVADEQKRRDSMQAEILEQLRIANRKQPEPKEVGFFR